MWTINMVPDSACHENKIIFYAYNVFYNVKGFSWDVTDISLSFSNGSQWWRWNLG